MSKVRQRTIIDPKSSDVVLKSLFLKYDNDGNGMLTHEELSNLFMDLGINNEQASVYSLLLDRDGSNDISYDEFKTWFYSGEEFQNIKDTTRYHRLKSAVDMFRRYDTNDNHSLDRNEFEKLFLDMGGKKEGLDGALKELDRDSNGRVSFQEFLRWLNWIPMDDFK